MLPFSLFFFLPIQGALLQPFFISTCKKCCDRFRAWYIVREVRLLRGRERQRERERERERKMEVTSSLSSEILDQCTLSLAQDSHSSFLLSPTEMVRQLIEESKTMYGCRVLLLIENKEWWSRRNIHAKRFAKKFEHCDWCAGIFWKKIKKSNLYQKTTGINKLRCLPTKNGAHYPRDR